MKVQRIEGIGYQFKCFCGRVHIIHTDKRNNSGASWRFNGNLEAPTFDPSINYSEEGYRNDDLNIAPFRCHFNITAGMIIFHGDSTHQYTGTTQQLPLIKEA
jgi:uncharacterized protein DUF6527